MSRRCIRCCWMWGGGMKRGGLGRWRRPRGADLRGLVADPAAARGAVLVVEGRFAGRVRDVKLLRGGPWGKTVTEWGLVVDGPKDAAGRVAIVYFAGAVTRPRDRQRVRVVGRFFKTWTDVDAAGVETTYPVFVAAPFWVTVGGERTGARWQVMVVLVLGLTAGLWGVRRVLRREKRRPTRTALKDRGTRGQRGDAMEVEDAGLPEDPAEALGVLRERGNDGRHAGDG